MTERISAATAALFILLASGVCQTARSAVKTLPADVRAALKETHDFQVTASISTIPDSVRSSFAKAAHEKSFSMAEPGAQWQSTDVVLKPELPRRRLGKVALSKSFCIVFYEVGGIGWSYHVAVFRLVQGKAELAWKGVSSLVIVDPPGLLRAIDSGKVDDNLSHSF